MLAGKRHALGNVGFVKLSPAKLRALVAFSGSR